MLIQSAESAEVLGKICVKISTRGSVQDGITGIHKQVVLLPQRTTCTHSNSHTHKVGLQMQDLHRVQFRNGKQQTKSSNSRFMCALICKNPNMTRVQTQSYLASSQSWIPNSAQLQLWQHITHAYTHQSPQDVSSVLIASKHVRQRCKQQRSFSRLFLMK